MEEIEDALPREAARFVLTLINREVRTLGVDRLVRSVVVSGNRELRANVALGLILLSTQSEETYGNEVECLFSVTRSIVPTTVNVLVEKRIHSREVWYDHC